MAIALNIPSQIEKYLSLSLFPATGNDFTLYIANDTNRLYQWSGSAYVEVSQQDVVNWGSIGGDIINQTDLQLALSAKVNTEAGKGLSTNDYTTAEKNKLAGIEAGAQVNDVDSVNGQTGAVVLTKSDVGLGNVDNTSDANKPISTATQTALNAKQNSLGYTPVPETRTLTINGTTQDLSADRTFTISTGITIGTTAITSGTVGRVLFQGTGNVVSQSANLFWDNTNGRLGIGTSSPTKTLDSRNGFSLYSSGVSPNGYYLEATSSTTSDGTLNFQRVIGGTGNTRLTFQGLEINTNTNSGINQLLATSGQSWAILTNGSEKMRVLAGGNVLINTTTDAGFRLDVNGTARVKGDFVDLDSTNNERFKITDNASAGNSYTFLKRFDNTKDIFHVIFPSGTLTTSNVNWNFGIKGNTNNFSIASYDGGASATERFVITNTGNVLIGTSTNGASRLRVVGLPTSSAGLSAGDIWNDAGTLKIV